jgi:hypothetical protein
VGRGFPLPVFAHKGFAMSINSIQTDRGVLAIRSSPERDGSRGDARIMVSARLSPAFLSGSSSPTDDTQSRLIHARMLLNRIDYTKEQLDKILVDYPPFFPPGTYQRVDLIKGIRSIQDEVEKSSVPSETRSQIVSRKLGDNATDGDIAVALDQLFSFGDEIAQGLSQSPGSFGPGSLVNVRI